MNEEEKRRWAIEQAVKMHGPGANADTLITIALRLIKFVEGRDESK